MGTKRSCLGVCSLDGLIYCCGGYDGASCLSSVERYDPLTGVWPSCPAMNTRRRYCRVAVLGNENKLSLLPGLWPDFKIIASTPWEDLIPLTTNPAWRGWTQGWESGSPCHPWPAGGLPVELQPWMVFFTVSEEMTGLCVLVCQKKGSNLFLTFHFSFSHRRTLQSKTQCVGIHLQHEQQKVNSWSQSDWWSALCNRGEWWFLQS